MQDMNAGAPGNLRQSWGIPIPQQNFNPSSLVYPSAASSSAAEHLYALSASSAAAHRGGMGDMPSNLSGNMATSSIRGQLQWKSSLPNLSTGGGSTLPLYHTGRELGGGVPETNAGAPGLFRQSWGGPSSSQLESMQQQQNHFECSELFPAAVTPLTTSTPIGRSFFTPIQPTLWSSTGEENWGRNAVKQTLGGLIPNTPVPGSQTQGSGGPPPPPFTTL